MDKAYGRNGQDGNAGGGNGKAELCGKNYGFLRIFPRFSTIFRTDQGRNYAILRIFTGESLFFNKEAMK